MAQQLMQVTHTLSEGISAIPVSLFVSCLYTVEPFYSPDTNGAEESVVVSEVSSFQSMQE